MSRSASEHQVFDTLDALIDAMYRSVSGPEPGLDMELQQRVFAPKARMIRTGIGDDGQLWRTDMSVEDYEENTREFLKFTVFFEYETARKVTHCPPFAYVLSEYEAKSDLDSDALLLSGVNSIQCYFDGTKWQVTQLLWNHHSQSKVDFTAVTN